jgi:hypothetical protein
MTSVIPAAHYDEYMETLRARDIRYGRVSFFLGAGASLHRDPSILEGADNRRRARLPSGIELATELASMVGTTLPEGASGRLIEVATFLETLHDRSVLAGALRSIFDVRYPPGAVHRFLAELPAEEYVVMTTNWDLFIERAFEETGRPYHVLVNTLRGSGRHRPTPSEYWENCLWLAPGAKNHVPFDGQVTYFTHPVIFKIHGSLDPRIPGDSFVISEEDYYEMAGREYATELLPGPIVRDLVAKPVIFLGYGLGDIHIRHVMRSMHRPPLRDLVVLRAITEFQKSSWKRQGIETMVAPIDECVALMSALLRED